jgi:hypothetical protein
MKRNGELIRDILHISIAIDVKIMTLEIEKTHLVEVSKDDK